MAAKYSFKQVKLLDEQACQKIVEKIHRLKKIWTPRMGSEIPFYTLGAASYLDGHDYENYLKLAQQINPLLLAHFRDLYISLAKTLEKETSEVVKFDEKLALPGFHIFQYHPVFKTHTAAAHFDLQYKEVPWTYKKIDYDNPISFTLSLSLPKSGGGLNYWNLDYEAFKDKPRHEVEKIQEQSEQKFIPYQEGSMIVQKGLFLHQIARSSDLQPNDERITLQGHGLICDGALRLYW